MKKKLLKVVLLGKTNAGKSSLINQIVGETVSISNKKINTTNQIIKGLITLQNVQIILYDTPGLNFFKTEQGNQKKFKTNVWQCILNTDVILFLLDSKTINLEDLYKNLKKIVNLEKKVFLVFNKIDLVNKDNLLPLIKEISDNFSIDSFFNISAKYNLGLDNLLKYLMQFAKNQPWEYDQNDISNKDDIFITNECTRNAILTYLHKELPYNIEVKNKIYKKLNNGDFKIKQIIKISNERYKKIILGKKGDKIKQIREFSQKNISKIIKSKVHLYIEVTN